MTAKQKKFAQHYVMHGNATQAAREAGYSESYASHRSDLLLRNVEIQKYISELNDKILDEHIISVKRRQALLSDIALSTSEETSDRIRAVDTLNKMTGAYIVNISAKVETSEKLSDIFSQIGGAGLEE